MPGPKPIRTGSTVAGQTFLAVSIGVLAGSSFLLPTLAQKPSTGMVSCSPFLTTCSPLTVQQVQQARRAQDRTNAADLKQALTDPDPRVREQAVYDTDKKAVFAFEAVQAVLVAGAFDPDPRVRAAITCRLKGARGSDPPIDVLLKALQDSEALVRRCAAQQLRLTTQATARVMPALVRALQDGDNLVQESAVGALSAIGTPARPAIPALAKLRDKAIYASSAAHRAIDRIDPKAPNPLPEKLKQANEEYKTKMAEVMRPHIRKGLEDSDPERRERALQMLSLLPEAEAVAALNENWRSSNPRIKMAAACGIGQAEVPFEAVSAILLELSRDADWMVRGCALQSLARLRPDGSELEVLLEGLSDPNPALRSQAAQGLGKLDTLAPDAVDALITALRDDNPFVRQAAAEALGNQKVTRAAPALEVMKARSQKINGRLWVDGEAAERALRQIEP